jgi:hypothetical protein
MGGFCMPDVSLLREERLAVLNMKWLKKEELILIII